MNRAKETRMVDKLHLTRSAAPVREQVLKALRSEIVEGRFPPGKRLTERELTEMLGVSRTVLRESLRQLEAEGLISLIPNQGPVVRALTVGEARELYRIREALEGLAARLFAEQNNPDRIAELEQAYSAVEAAYHDGDPRAILAAKNDFYAAMHTGAGSQSLSKMLSIVLAQVWRWRAMGLAHPNRSTERSVESTRILSEMVEAIRAGEADTAERAAKEDTRLAAAEVLRLLDTQADAELMPAQAGLGDD